MQPSPRCSASVCRASLARPFPSPPPPQVCPHGPPPPHLSLCLSPVSACFATVLSTSLPCSVSLCVSLSAFFLPQDLFLMFPLLLFVTCSIRDRNCPSLRIGKWPLCPTCSTPNVPAPAASLMLGGGWTTPLPLGCGGRAWIRTEAVPSWIRQLPTRLPCA